MDVVENSNLPEEEKEKVAKQQTAPSETLLSKRKQPEKKPIEENQEPLEETKTVADCLQQHK